MKKKYNIAILPGDGIGKEIMLQACKIIHVIKNIFKINICIKEYDIGGIAIDKHNCVVPHNTIKGCKKSHAILFGAVGGEKWRHLPLNKQPESGALLFLRKYFNLFANLRPIRIYSDLINLSPIKNKIISKGFDIICVRELIGGIYFNQKKGTCLKNGYIHSYDTEYYTSKEIEKIAHLAFKIARKRSKKVTSIDKANVLESSKLWRNIVNNIHKKYYSEINLNHLYIDNATMQIMKNPYKFDVLLCSNLFGDIISDECAMIAGSIGMVPSASINNKNFGLYEPIGGSSPNIAGKNIANPIGQILSLALLFRYSLKKNNIADIIENSVIKAINLGYRTFDIVDNKKKSVSTDIMGDIISSFISEKK